MIDEVIDYKRRKNSSSEIRESTCGATSESTVVISSTNLLLSSSSTSTNEYSTKTNEQANLFENIISTYQDSSENTNLDDEKLDKLDNSNANESGHDDTNDNSFDCLNNSCPKRSTNKGNSLNEILDDLILFSVLDIESQKLSVETREKLDSANMGMLTSLFYKCLKSRLVLNRFRSSYSKTI